MRTSILKALAATCLAALTTPAIADNVTSSPLKVYAAAGQSFTFDVNFAMPAAVASTDLRINYGPTTASSMSNVFAGCIDAGTTPAPYDGGGFKYILWLDSSTSAFPTSAACGSGTLTSRAATFSGTAPAPFPNGGAYSIQVVGFTDDPNSTANDVTVCQKRTVSSVTASPATEGAVITYTVNFDSAVAVGCGGFAVPGVLSGTATTAPDTVVLLGTGTCANVADSATSCTILAQGADDTAVDGTKVATLTITDSTAASNYVSVGKTASANVLDNESSIAVALGRNGAEGGNSVQFVVTCNGPGTNVTVNYAWSGTATAADFTAALPTSTSFATCNGATQTVDLALVDDTLVEGTENVTLTISTPTANVAVVVGQSAATATISDNDSDPVFGLVTIAACAEPSTGCAFALNRLSGVTSARTLTFAVTGTATRGTDYDLKSGTDCATGTVIPVATNSVVHNSAGGQTLNVCPIDDLLPEVGGETVILTLTTAGSVANALYTLDAATTSRTQTIADDDSPQVVTVAGPGGPIAEAAGTGTFTFTRTGGSAAAQGQPLTVNIGRSGTATFGAACTAGVDYMSSVAGTTLMFASGSTATITVTACQDTLVDPAETIIYSVAPPTVTTDYTVGSPASATGTIADDEVGVSVSGNGATEGSPVSFVLTCTGPAASTATVTFAISGQDAGAVITPAPGPVTVTCGTPTTVTVSTTNDAIQGNSRSVGITLTNPVAPAVLVGAGTASASVLDNDAPLVVPTMSMLGLGFMSLMLAGFVAFQRRRVQK